MIIMAEKCPHETRRKCKDGSCPKSGFTAPDIFTDTSESDIGHGEVLVCCKCLGPVTYPTETMEVNGLYNHSFTNPNGLFFEISCFKNAPGCSYSNESSSEFTWFMGFNWRVAVCRNCMSHLGWLFTSATSSFHGLISEKLILSRFPEE